jgi:hypothetical protein
MSTDSAIISKFQHFTVTKTSRVVITQLHENAFHLATRTLKSVLPFAVMEHERKPFAYEYIEDIINS